MSSVHQVVSSQVFDVLWSEVVTVLLPLLIATRDRALKGRFYDWKFSGPLGSVSVQYVIDNETILTTCRLNVSLFFVHISVFLALSLFPPE